MPEAFKLTRIPSLKTVADFRNHVASLGLSLPCEDATGTGNSSPLTQPIPNLVVNGKHIGNRWAIHPMEGWDATTTGGATDEVRRRWQRFGASGAKVIYGGEAMAVRPDGRANPNQLIIVEENKRDLAALREILVKAHRERYGTTDAQVFTDAEIEELIQCYIRAAKIAREVGADFVDIKHCHGYLLHEFLGAHTRRGKFGGTFENRTRILREIISGIRASGNKIEIG